MTAFPKITRPCPYKDRLGEVMDGDFCRMCKRQVTDLSAMNDDEVAVFLKSCSGGEEVCISYRVPVRAMLGAAAAVALSATPFAAAAETPQPPDQAPSSSPAQTAAEPTAAGPASEEVMAPTGTEVGGFVIISVTRDDNPRGFPEPIEMRPRSHG